MPKSPQQPQKLTPAEVLARRRRRKPWLSLALLVVVLIFWYRYWIPPTASWLWHAAHGNSAGWHGRSIAVPKGWYARWQSRQPELRHLAVPLAIDATVTVVALPASSEPPYDNFRAHAPDLAKQSGFPIQTIRTFVHGSNRAFCLQGFSNADFALLYRGSAIAEPDFDAVIRSVLQ